jgi:hypothetical protein
MDEQQEEKKQSYILIRFPEIGSALMDIRLENVTAGQLFIASKILDLKAQAGFIQEETERMQREAERNIARPTQGILTAHK